MVATDVNVQVTQEDVNEVIRNNPLVALQLQVRALTRTCQEQADKIDQLEIQITEIDVDAKKSIEEEGD
jgi:hypothetical protein